MLCSEGSSCRLWTSRSPGDSGSRTPIASWGTRTRRISFAKTWQVGASYRRGIDYVQGLREPVLTDGFSGRMEGRFNRRMALLASAGYVSGTSALLRSSSAFDTYTSDVRLNVTLGRSFTPYLQYVYYLWDFRRYGPLVAGIPPALERNGLRVGFTLAVPTLDW